MDLLTTTACTLPTHQRPLRLAEFDAVFATALVAIERPDSAGRSDDATSATAVLQLSGDVGLGETVRELVARESSCCSFFDFDVTGTDDDLRLRITVPTQHHDLLGSLLERAKQAHSGAVGLGRA